MEKFREERPRLELPESPKYDPEEQRKTMDEIIRQGDEERAERRDFRERLLSEMACQTALLERIAARLEGS